MPKKIFKIAHIASEVDPFSKTGGLAVVTRSLPKALKRLGHDVIVVTPLYGQIIDKKKHKLKEIAHDVKVRIDDKNNVKVNFWKGFLMEGLPTYFIENEKYFSKRKKLYGSTHENARFLLFDIAALKLLTYIKFPADIIHCHDWQTGLVPYFFQKGFKRSPVIGKATTIFTIHNLAFQMGISWWKVPLARKDFGTKKLPNFDDPKLEYINFAKRAILNADVISTVSETYAQEILTPRFGQDLHRILSNRRDRLFGIVNGIDYGEYNPLTDPGLHRNFSYKSPHLKVKNKLGLQKMFGLPQDEKIPVIGMVTRIAEQKGFELLFDALDGIMTLNVQLMIMGGGDKRYIKRIKEYMKKYPKKIGATLEFSKHATRVYAGSDFFLMPSRFEPCGITQLEAMRYGAIPIVRHIGGLVDTVTNFDPRTGKGNGFVFKKYDSRALLIAVIRALETYKYKDVWNELVVDVMRRSYSWELPASKYVELYKKAIKIKQKNGKSK
jgi:starch synthase